MNPNFIHQTLQELGQKNLYRKLRTLEPVDAVRARFGERELLLFCGNDYLGLSHHPQVVQAFQKAAVTHGVGAGAARLISGTSDWHTRLEEKIARFKNTQAALIYTAGYLANLGVLTSLAAEKDLIVMDKLCHASLIDGARLSGAEIRVFPHKNYERCEEILSKAGAGQKKILVSDTVFSMDGDLANLEELIRLRNQFKAILLVDDAHGLGVLGKSGRGLTEGFEEGIDVITGTLSKTVGAIGGFAACSSEIREYLINTSRPFIFATALPPAICAAACEAFQIMESPKLRDTLWGNVRIFSESLGGIHPESPIIPFGVGDEVAALKLSEILLKEGFLVPAVRTPTVPKGKARLRITLSAAHGKKDILRLADRLKHQSLGDSHLIG